MKYKMSKWVMSMLLIVGSWSVVLAQSDANATALMKKVSDTYEKQAVIKIKFSMQVEIPEEEGEEQQGTIWLKGTKYRLDMAGTQIICDNKQVKTILADDPEDVILQDYEPEEGAITPANLLHLWKTGFTATMGEKSTTMQEVVLIPIDKEKAYNKVTMKINTQSNTISNAIIFDKNGNRYIYNIMDFDPAPKVDDAFFRI